MSTKPAVLRAGTYGTVGSIVLRDTGIIIERWATRAQEDQPSAHRVHHDDLLDHLPTFLWEMGRSLSKGRGDDSLRLCRPAKVHGDQRWQLGWSVQEVVRDYQILRIVVTEYLDETIERPLRTRELLALGVFIDDAIAASVEAYTACLAESCRQNDLHSISKEKPALDLLEILGVLGHELRNPLAPLGNAIQLLKVCSTDTTAVERVQGMMNRQVRIMTRLVDDLLDLTRLDRAKVQLKLGHVDLAVLARHAVDDRREAFEAAGIAISLDLPVRPVHTNGDLSRLSQVMGNLLQNAAKFTDRGGSVAIRLAIDDSRRVAIFAVKDTGIGIHREVLPTVFDPFVQADRSVERSRGGLGLGLALVKGLVELHGGSVGVESDGTGMGSEFIVELPLIDMTASKPETTPTIQLAAEGRRILLVEDNPDSAESLKMYLELLGHRVIVAHTGTEALKTVAGFSPDVVLCDIGLPGMSGHSVCAELRKIPALAKTFFVALSGHAPDSPAASTATGGFDLHMLKPVEPNRLAALIAGLGGQETGAS